MSTSSLTRRHWLITTGAALGLAACGGGADRTKARIRLVNASSGYDALDMTIDDQRLFAGVPYGDTASYVEADPDHMASTIRRPNSATALLSFTPVVSEDRDYTLLAWGKEGQLNSMLLDDNTSQPDSGKALVRVLNAAPDAGALDVYLTGSADPLVDAVALQAGAAAGTLGGQVPVTSGSWRLRVTAAGDKSDLRLDVSGLALPDRSSATLVITPGSGGVLVNALLLVDRGAIVRADNVQARVRVASGMPLGSLVAASAGSTVLVSGGGGLTVGSYRLVAAGAQALTVTVNGVAASGAAASLAAGGDHTLLVYGSADAPLYTLLADDNQTPSTASLAKLRLVHGVTGISGTLSLTTDFAPVADGVAQGQASAYAEVPAGTGKTLTCTTPGRPTPVTNELDKELKAGSVYTYFVVGTQDAPQGILKLDRL